MLKLKLQYFGHLMQRADSFAKTLMLGKVEVGGKGDDRGWDGWMASLTHWTWVWASSRNWWWTGKLGVLQSMGVSESDWTDWTNTLSDLFFCSPVMILWCWWKVPSCSQLRFPLIFESREWESPSGRVHLGWFNKIPQTYKQHNLHLWLINNITLFLTVLEAESLRLRFWHNEGLLPGS